MRYFKTRMAGFILAFGIFFTLSCANLMSSEDSSADTQHDDFQSALNSINIQIADDPDNISLRVSKAELLYNKARSYQEPAPRLPYYQNMRDLSDEISYQTTERVISLDNILIQAWTEEQSDGIRLLQKQREETAAEPLYEKIIGHFKNAITLLPDSTTTHSLKATTYYKNGDPNKAIETLAVAEEIAREEKPEITEKLAYLNLETGNIDAAIAIYRNLVEKHPGNTHLKHGLANAYTLNEQHSDAVNLLTELVDEFPSRYEYQEALATELYFQFREHVHETLQQSESRSIGSDQIESFKEHLGSIDQIFDTLRTKLPSMEEITYRSASFYKNAAGHLHSLSLSSDEDQVEKLLELRLEYLEKAMPLWERLTESNPENSDYHNNLHRIYIALELNEEAEALERSLNF